MQTQHYMFLISNMAKCNCQLLQSLPNIVNYFNSNACYRDTFACYIACNCSKFINIETMEISGTNKQTLMLEQGSVVNVTHDDERCSSVLDNEQITSRVAYESRFLHGKQLSWHHCNIGVCKLIVTSFIPL